jgi:hypothetical protein
LFFFSYAAIQSCRINNEMLQAICPLQQIFFCFGAPAALNGFRAVLLCSCPWQPFRKLRLFLGLCPLPPQRLSLLGLLKKKTHLAYDRSTEAPDLL